MVKPNEPRRLYATEEQHRVDSEKMQEMHREHRRFTTPAASPFLALVPLECRSGDGGCLASQQSGASQADSVAFYLVDGWGNWRI